MKVLRPDLQKLYSELQQNIAHHEALLHIYQRDLEHAQIQLSETEADLSHARAELNLFIQTKLTGDVK